MLEMPIILYTDRMRIASEVRHWLLSQSRASDLSDTSNIIAALYSLGYIARAKVEASRPKPETPADG